VVGSIKRQGTELQPRPDLPSNAVFCRPLSGPEGYNSVPGSPTTADP
jgi:hypothetical protein